MIVVLTNWIACFRKHDVGIREEASFLVDAYGVQGQREALQRKLDANSFTSARYWSGVETEAARYVGRGQTRFVFDAAWDERLRARSLARAIEAAQFDVAGEARAHAPGDCRPALRAAISMAFRRRRPTPSIRTTLRPNRHEPGPGAARRSADACILAFPKR